MRRCGRRGPCCWSCRWWWCPDGWRHNLRTGGFFAWCSRLGLVVAFKWNQGQWAWCCQQSGHSTGRPQGLLGWAWCLRCSTGGRSLHPLSIVFFDRILVWHGDVVSVAGAVALRVWIGWGVIWRSWSWRDELCGVHSPNRSWCPGSLCLSNRMRLYRTCEGHPLGVLHVVCPRI